jgi:hypothetical protein
MRTLIVFLLLAVAASVCEAQWVPVGLAGRGIRDIAIGNNSMFAVTNDSGSVYRSTNRGGSWGLVILRGGSHVAISPTTETVFVSSNVADTVYRSTDNGASWSSTHVACINLAVNPYGIVFSGEICRGLYCWWSEVTKSSDDGLTWAECHVAGGDNYAFDGQYTITAGSSINNDTGPYFPICMSSNSGQTWDTLGSGPSSLPADCILAPTALAWSNGRIFYGGMATWCYPTGIHTGLFVSHDTSRSWAQIYTYFAVPLSENPRTPEAIVAIPSNNVLVGTNGDGVFLFSDTGDSLGSRNQGLTSLQVDMLALDPSGYVYAGTGSGVWRRPISELATSVRLSSGDLPNKFILEQNYPNPFNPSTTIRYALPHTSFVTLTVYNTLGQQVAQLVNEQQQAGYHDVVFRGDGLASSVYFYRIQAGEYIASRKLLLLKQQNCWCATQAPIRNG